MEFRIADTFTDSLAQPDRRRAEGRQDDGLRPADEPGEPGHAVSQARQGQGPELLVGSRQPRHPADRPQDRGQPACSATSITTTRPTPGPSGGSSRRIRRRCSAAGRGPRDGAGDRRSRRMCRSRPRPSPEAEPLFADSPRRRAAGLRRARRSGLTDVRVATEDTLLELADHLPAKPRRRSSSWQPAGRRAVRRRRSARTRPVRASRCAAPLPRDDQRRGAGARARLPVGEVDGLPPSGAAADRSSATTTVRRGSRAQREPERPSSPCIAPFTWPAPIRDARVLLTTFSEPLANALRTKLRRLISNEPRLGERIDVYSHGRRRPAALRGRISGRRRSATARPVRRSCFERQLPPNGRAHGSAATSS